MELIITEKPSSAEKIAHALADGKPTVKTTNKIKYYELTHNGKDISVVSAVGHLYTVAEKKKKKGWTYPIFDIEWVASHTKSKDAAFTKKYLTLIQRMAKKADEITIATDFDIEGEVIGYTVMKYACKKDDANRMKFSTVTEEDLLASYEDKSPTIAWGQANAGTTRHELDWYYGINLSRALTLSVKAAGGFKILSSGRVQTPALKILADKEKEIAAFKPDPFWQIELHTPKLMAMHVEDKFWKKEEAEAALGKVTDTATVAELKTRKFNQAPPAPFDLTTLQTEAYRSMRITPKETASHAQQLYSNGYISYPRTSSNQLPANLDIRKILKQLQKHKDYGALAADLLAQKGLKPNNGKKTDPAHPAIYPTGVKPSKARDRSRKIYDLIVRRFMATFGEPAERETQTVVLESGGEQFSAKGTHTTKKGWHEYYGSHVKISEDEMPPLDEGEELKVEKTELLDKETQPPKRYTPSSIIKELEKHGLGTKATRADIVENLFNRGYIFETSIEVQEIGMRTIGTLEKYVPRIVDDQLTRHIEEELEKVRSDEIKPAQVLEHAREHLNKILDEFKKHEKEIGAELLAAERETRDKRTLLGECKTCGEGELQIRRGKFGLFIGCTNYPDCTATYGIPTGMPLPAGKLCPWCEMPMITVTQKRRGKRPHCFNPECASKELTDEGKKTAESLRGNPCPRCKEGKLDVKDSKYGKFIGCSRYPKCRYTESSETVWQANPDRVKAAMQDD